MCHAYRLEKESLATSSIQLPLSRIKSICGRISNMGEAINMLSFNVIIFFKFNIAKMHSQKNLSHFFCDASVPVPNGHTIIRQKNMEYSVKMW